MTEPGGFIYIIRVGEYAKVGYSRDPHRRLRTMNNYLPVEPVFAAIFPGTRAIENKLHWFLLAHHTRKEWFRWCPEIARIAKEGVPEFGEMPIGSPFYAANGGRPRRSERAAESEKAAS